MNVAKKGTRKISKMTDAGKVLFHLTDDALIVANSGEGFTRKGVISICYSCISPKWDNPPQDIYQENGVACLDARLPLLIREKMLEMDINARNSFMGAETHTTEDYAGRFELELLQNADDAIGSDNSFGLIGNKGKGFKSVLEITDRPEISSGDFNFALEKQDDGFRMPECLPRPIKSTHFPEAATVIRLGLRDGLAKDVAKNALTGIRPEMLLLCQHLSRVEVHIDGEYPRILELGREGVSGFDNVKKTFILKEDGSEQKWDRWSAVWSPENGHAGEQLSVALCLPRNADGEVAALKQDQALHVFFPTEEKIPGLRVLPHASYELEGNRKHLLAVDKQPHGAAIREQFGKLASNIINEIPPAVSLRAFGRILNVDEGEREIEFLQQRIHQTIAGTCFVPVIGGQKVRPAETRLWRHGLGYVLRQDHDVVCNSRLLLPYLASDDEAKKILRGLGAKSIGDPLAHAELLLCCENSDSKKCAAALRVASKIFQAVKNSPDEEMKVKVLEKLKAVPCWFTDNMEHSARSLQDGILLWMRPDDWPKWLQADALTPEFVGEIEEQDLEDFKKAVGYAWPLDEGRYFEEALIKFCGGQSPEWWEKMGDNVLVWALEWGTKHIGEDVPCQLIVDKKGGKNDERNKAGASIRLPTNNGWLPAIYCYFGADWEGHECFNVLGDKGVIQGPDRWPTIDKGTLRRMLVWLGVARTPKVYLATDGGYCFIEQELNLLASVADKQKLFGDICEMAESAESHTYRQLQNAELIPCKPGILKPDIQMAKPGDVHMPGKGIRGYLPEVDASEELDEKMKFQLLRLGVKDALPPPTEQSWWIECMRKMSEKARSLGDNSKDLRWEKGRPIGRLAEVIRELYDKYGASLQGMGDVPYLHQTSDGDLYIKFAPSTEVRWLDQEHHQDPAVYQGILGVLKIFPFELLRGRRFELPPVSGDTEWLHKLVGQCASEERLRWDKDKGDIAKFIEKLYRKDENLIYTAGKKFAPYLRKTKQGIFIRFATKIEVRWADKHYYEEPEVRLTLLSNEQFKIFPWFLNLGERFGITRLSKDIQRYFIPGEDDADVTERIWSDYSEREKAFALLVGDNEKQLSKHNIQACESLELVLRDNSDQQIATSQVDFILGKDNKIYINTQHLWRRAFAAGLATWMGKAEYREKFECILNDRERKDWIRRLREHGISKDDLAPLEAEEEHVSESQAGDGFSETPAPAGANASGPDMPYGKDVMGSPSNNGHIGHQQAKEFRPIPSPGTDPAHKRGGEAAGQRSHVSPTPTQRSQPEQDLCRQIRENPAKIGIPKAEVREQYKLPSKTDVVDLLCITENEYVAVEVKSGKCVKDEIQRGAYQCVKYDAVLKAAIAINDWQPCSGRTIFALGGKFPAELAPLRKFLEERGIEVIESLAE